jgi:hypothetical protein
LDLDPLRGPSGMPCSARVMLYYVGNHDTPLPCQNSSVPDSSHVAARTYPNNQTNILEQVVAGYSDHARNRSSTNQENTGHECLVLWLISNAPYSGLLCLHLTLLLPGVSGDDSPVGAHTPTHTPTHTLLTRPLTRPLARPSGHPLARTRARLPTRPYEHSLTPTHIPTHTPTLTSSSLTSYDISMITLHNNN